MSIDNTVFTDSGRCINRHYLIALVAIIPLLSSCNHETSINTNSSFLCDTPAVVKQQMLSLVNAARASGQACNGQIFTSTGAVTWSDALTAAAKVHSDDMAVNNFFSHRGSDGLQVGARVQAQGYVFISAGENIFAGAQDSGEAVRGWLASTTGHCEAIMNQNFREMGVACTRNANSEFGTYYTQVFGSR